MNIGARRWYPAAALAAANVNGQRNPLVVERIVFASRLDLVLVAWATAGCCHNTNLAIALSGTKSWRKDVF